MIKYCSYCGKAFSTRDKKRKYCGLEHYHRRQIMSPNKGGYQKGSIPWNKGLKGIHMSPETEFKKGQKSINQLPVGSIRIRKRYNRNNAPKKWIKIAEPNKWVLLAAKIWRDANGEIPKGYIIHHVNFNSLDDRLENLKLVTRSEHINIHRADLEKNRVIPCKYDISIEHLRAVTSGNMTQRELALIIGCSASNINHHVKMLRKKWKRGIIV